MSKQREHKELPHPIQAYSEALAEIERRLSELDNGDESISVAHHTGPPFMFFQERLFNVQQRIIRLIANGVIEMPDMIVPSIPRPIQFLNARFQLLTHGVDMAEEEAKDPFQDYDVVFTLIAIDGNDLTFRSDKCLPDYRIKQVIIYDENDDSKGFAMSPQTTDNYSTFKLTLQEPVNDYPNISVTIKNKIYDSNTEYEFESHDIDAFTTIGCAIKKTWHVVYIPESKPIKIDDVFYYSITITQVRNTKSVSLYNIDYLTYDNGNKFINVQFDNLSDGNEVKYSFQIPQTINIVKFTYELKDGVYHSVELDAWKLTRFPTVIDFTYAR